MCFNNIWSLMDISLYGLCVCIAKDTFSNRKKRCLIDRFMNKPEDQWSCNRSPEICCLYQKTCLNIMVFSSSAGADEALGLFCFFRIFKIPSICHFSCWLFPSNDILTVFPIQMHRQPMLTLP